jgi:muconolactone delta-isomerase
MALFAVTTKQNPSGITADEFRRRLPEGVAYMKTLIERGLVQDAWVRVGASGGLFLIDADSHEQLLEALYANPISPHLDFHVDALAPFGDFSGAFRPEDRS